MVPHGPKRRRARRPMSPRAFLGFSQSGGSSAPSGGATGQSALPVLHTSPPPALLGPSPPSPVSRRRSRRDGCHCRHACPTWRGARSRAGRPEEGEGRSAGARHGRRPLSRSPAPVSGEPKWPPPPPPPRFIIPRPRGGAASLAANHRASAGRRAISRPTNWALGFQCSD